MDFRQLEAFVKVVELASFSKAANELYISQPSVSVYIASLEKELDSILINRSTKVLSTTLAGKHFFDKAKEMLALKQETMESLRAFSDNASGEIHILASSVPALYILPHILAELRELYPAIHFTISQGDTTEVVEGIAEHRADIGFTGSILPHKKCKFCEFASEKMIFIAPKNARYSADTRYSLEDLLYANAFVAREYGSGTRMQYEKFFTDHNILLENIPTCAIMDSTQSIINAVASGLGISMVSEHAARNALKQQLLIPLKLNIDEPRRKIYTVLNTAIAPSHLVELFRKHLLNNKFVKAHCKDQPSKHFDQMKQAK